mgnify:CR=1 FL=1
MAFYLAGQPVPVNIRMRTAAGIGIPGLGSSDILLTLIREGITLSITGLYAISEQQKGVYRVVFDSSLMLITNVDYVLIAIDNTGQAIDDIVEFTLNNEYMDSVYTKLKSEIDINENKLDVISGYTDEVEALLKHTTYGLSALKTKLDYLDTQASLNATTLQNEVITQANQNEAKIDILTTNVSNIIPEINVNENKIDIITTYVDEVESLLKNVTFGLEAIKNKTNTTDTNVDNTRNTLQNEIVNQANENEVKIDQVISNQTTGQFSLLTQIGVNTAKLDVVINYVDTLEGLLGNATYGLNAIKTKIDEVDADLAIAKTVLQNEIITQSNENEVKIDNVSSSINTVIAEINVNENKLDSIINYVDEVEGLLKNVTYGLSTLKTKLDTIDVNASVNKTVLQSEIITQSNENEVKIDTITSALSTMETNLITEINQIPINPLLSTDTRANNLTRLDTTVSLLPALGAHANWAYPSRYLSGVSGINQIDIAGFSGSFIIDQTAWVNIAMVDVGGTEVPGRTYPGNLNIELWKAGVQQSLGSYLTVQETASGVYRTTIGGELIDIPAVDYVLIMEDTSAIALTQRVEFTAFELAGVAGPRVVTIYVSDSNTTLPLPDVQVYVKNDTNSMIINKGITGTDGKYMTGLRDGVYNLIMRKSFVDFITPLTLTVTGDTTAAYIGASFVPTSPGSPSTCMLYGWVVDVSGTYLRNAKVTATETQSARYSGALKIGKLTKATITDSNGYWELELVRSSLLTPSGIPYRIVITYPGFSYEKEVLIPDSSSVEFSTL